MKRALSLVLVWGACHAGARGETAPVFQIGIHDGDYHEFAIAGDYRAYGKRFPTDVDFVVGQSAPQQDWPYVQPGPADAWAGRKPHTFKIHFQMSDPGSGYYLLTVDFVGTQPSDPPRMLIDINGEKVEHTLPSGAGDDALANPKMGNHCSLGQFIPASVLRAGANTIALTTAEGCWALYDDIRLEATAAAPAEPLTVTAAPTCFFRRAPDGPRREVNLVIDNLTGGGGPATIRWRAGSSSGAQAANVHFGKNEIGIAVPDSGPIELTIQFAGKEITTSVTMPPVKKWLVYIVPTTHTDIGYTDLQERVRERHANNGLRQLEYLRRYPFLKWNSETFWQLDSLLQLHPEKTDAVFKLIRQGRWGLSASYANMLTGLCSHEALNRYALDSVNLARRGGVSLDSLILDDVPSAVGSLPMVMANSGVKYFIEGSNKDRAPHVGVDLKNPFYWEGADGSRVLSYISYKPSYAVAGYYFHTLEQATKKLPALLGTLNGPDYPYDAVVINGAYSDNREVEPWLPEVVEKWNARWAYPKLIPALPDEYFRYIEKNFSNDIPVVKTDFGGWWEDGAGSSALETVLDRRAEERAVTAEMLHSLAAVLAHAAYPKTNLDDVWHNILLYDEHTWGAAGSINQPDSEQTVKQWEVKSGFARAADAESRALLASGMKQLAAMTPPSDLVIFNSLAWPRRELVTTDTAASWQDIASGKVFSSQSLPEGGGCFLADDLPSIGYRSYRQIATPAEALPPAAQISGNVMENEYYKVTIDTKTGGIQSIVDKDLGRELVDSASEYALGELVYVTGGEGTYAVHSDLGRLPPPTFAYHRQTGTGLEHIDGPVFGELASHATAENFPGITMRARLYHGLKRLDLIYELDKTETLSKEAVYLAFPFAMDANQGGLWLEYPDEITEPLRDQHPSACRDWYSVQRWLAVSDGSATVELSPLDTPLVTLGGMTASTWPLKLSLKRGHLFAYIMNNYWHTNYKARQGGRFVFRFSIDSSTGGFSKKDAVVKGWNMFCRPVAAPGRKEGQAQLTAAQSLIQVTPEGMPLTAFKQAEQGNGYVLRLCDFSGEGGTATMTLPKAVRDLFRCNLVESYPQKLPGSGKTITVPVKSFGLTTIEARFKR